MHTAPHSPGLASVLDVILSFPLPLQLDRLSEVLEDPLPAAAGRRSPAGGRWGGPLGCLWRGAGRWDGRLRGLGPAGRLHPLPGRPQPHPPAAPLR